MICSVESWVGPAGRQMGGPERRLFGAWAGPRRPGIVGRKAARAKCAGRHVDRKVVGQADAQLAVTQ